TYVWFDALLNYYTFAQGRWPTDAQIIGKDILVPAHVIYWTIMLEAMRLPQPRRFVVHGWWLARGAKMSKSLGNVMNPMDYIDVYGADAFRYFVLSEMVTGQDADFTHERFVVRYESELANKFGNLVQRTIAMIGKYREGIAPTYSAEELDRTEQLLMSDSD